jgi:hypothetical protein
MQQLREMVRDRGKAGMLSTAGAREIHADGFRDTPRTRGHYDNIVGEYDGLPDIMGYQENGLSCLSPNLQDLLLYRQPRQRIERAERFVHQQNIGLDCKRARDFDALTHTAGQFMRIAIGEVAETDQVEQLFDDRGGLRTQPSFRMERKAKGDVLRHGGPREQSRVLEHHEAIRARPDDRRIVYQDAALARLQIPGDDREERTLAAAARADDAREAEDFTS